MLELVAKRADVEMEAGEVQVFVPRLPSPIIKVRVLGKATTMVFALQGTKTWC